MPTRALNAFLVLILCLSLTAPALAGSGDPDDVVAHFNKGTALYRDGKSQEALDEFLAAQKLSPRDAVINNWVGFLYLVQEKYTDAIPPLQQAIKSRPKY